MNSTVNDSGEENSDGAEVKISLKVTPIVNGIVIDHINAGKGIIVLNILGLPDLKHGSIVSVVMNVSTRDGKRKDIIKIEEKDLASHELDLISLISPDATINIIQNTAVVKKYKVQLPDKVKGIIRCVNPNCITNQREPVEPEFTVQSKDPVVLKCDFCERKLEDIVGHIIR